jgi:putative redox protein
MRWRCGDISYGSTSPQGAGGDDTAATPTELFVTSLATCAAFYAGRYLTRHGYSRDGLGVLVEYEMATDRPACVAAVRLTLRVPSTLSAERRPARSAGRRALHGSQHAGVSSGDQH